MADVNNEVRTGEQPDQKPKFKTNKVNVMFRQTAAETEPPKDRDSASPGPAVAKPATKSSSLALSHGRFTLAAIREPSASSSSSPSPAPQAWQRPGDGAAPAGAGSTAPPSGASGSSAGTDSSHPRSVELNEEELTAKGISLAGRFHSSSDVHWEDEEDDWMPPPNPSGDATKRDAVKKGDGAASSEAEKPSAPALKPADSPADSSPWSSGQRRTGPPAARPLTETIKEMKEQKGYQRKAPAAATPHTHIPPRPIFGSQNVAPGSDGLSRFRIRGDARAPIGPGAGGFPIGRGPPPLNPRDALGHDSGFHHAHHAPPHSRYDAPIDEDFSMFAKRKPLATPHDPKPSAAPAPKPAAIPERLHLKSEPAAPTPAAPPAAGPTENSSDAASKNPATIEQSPAANAAPKPEDPKPEDSKPETPKPTAPAPDPQQAAKSAQEQQKEEMRAILAAAKAKREAEEKAEREKQERLARKREEMRREIEEKHAREREEKERQRKERQARLEERSQQIRAQREEREKQEREQREQREQERQERAKIQRERELERENEREPAHPVHSAADWAAAKKKAGGPIFQQAWNGKSNGAKDSESRLHDNTRDVRFRDTREPRDARRAEGSERGSSVGSPRLSQRESATGAGSKRGGSKYDLPVSVAPISRPKNAYFADEQHSSHSRRPVRVKLPQVETVGGFDVKEMMLLEASSAVSEFSSTASVEGRPRRFFREPLADRRPSNVRMPGDKSPKQKPPPRSFRGSMKPRQHVNHQQRQASPTTSQQSQEQQQAQKQ